MRIVVTGATGFLGLRISRMLLDRGHEVVGLGRDQERGRQLVGMGARFVAHDFAQDAANVATLIGTADAFIHAAAFSSAWGHTRAFEAANIEGTRRALELARSCDAKRFVLVSSPSVLFRYADQLDLDETTPLPRPVNAYAWSKRCAEALVLQARDLHPVILRPRALYGPGDRALLPRLIAAARRGALPRLRGGRSVTNLTFVDDAAESAILAAAPGEQLDGEIFHIAGPEVLPLTTIIEQATRHANVPLAWRPAPWPLAYGLVRAGEMLAALRPGCPEPRITAYGLGILAFSQTLSIEKARSRLGFTPRITFAEGLARTFAVAEAT